MLTSLTRKQEREQALRQVWKHRFGMVNAPLGSLIPST